MHGAQDPRNHPSNSTASKKTTAVSNRTLQKVTLSEIGVPLRKRTEKACDQCRRRKTKCDGGHDCKACSEIGLDCSYGNRTKQARGPSYVAHLERRLKQLENDEDKRSALESWGQADQSSSFDQHGALSRPQSPHEYSPSSSESSIGSSGEMMPPYVPRLPIEEEMSFASSNKSLKRGNSDHELATSFPKRRTPSEILTDAKAVLDNLSPINYTARYAAECLESINQNIYQTPLLSQSIQDFPLFESNSNAHDSNINFEPLNTYPFMPDIFIDHNQAFANPPNTPIVPEPGYMFFPTPAA